MKSLFSRSAISALLLSVALGLSACGSLVGDYSCDLRPKNPQCTDWRNLIGPTVTQEALCKTLNTAGGSGVFAAVKCPLEGTVGGCQTNTGAGLQTNWFYAPRTTSDVQAECTKDKTTYVAP